jgi:hypothetical protein
MKKVILVIALLLAVQPTEAQRRPQAQPAVLRVGTCVRTTIREVSQRLEDGNTRRPMPDSGSAVEFANGLYQVSYEQVAAVNQSRRGDPVFVCLMKLPTHCPPGDVRGKLYTTTNLRTGDSWTLSDSEHDCGGA